MAWIGRRLVITFPPNTITFRKCERFIQPCRNETMIRITKIETVYPAPEDDEDDYCPDGESQSTDDSVTFRELVYLMRDYSFSSCSPASGGVNEWLSTEQEQDYMTGDWTEHSLHFSHDNPSRVRKYWRKAMITAGLI